MKMTIESCKNKPGFSNNHQVSDILMYVLVSKHQALCGIESGNVLRTLDCFVKNLRIYLILLKSIVKTHLFKMGTFEETIIKLRKEKTFPLRTVAAFPDTDQAIGRKIECTQRSATHLQEVKLTKFLKIRESELLFSWLTGKLVYELVTKQLAVKELHPAEDKIKYQRSKFERS